MTQKFPISVQQLSKTYQLKTGLFSKVELSKVLNDISFSLAEGETLGVLGESGSGKSTLAKLLVGEESVTSGSIYIDGEDVTHLTIHERLANHRKIRMVYQDPYASLNPSISIADLLEEPLKNITKLNKTERKKRIIEVLNLVGLKSEHGRRLPQMLSPGERQRIAIARALILDPVCIVLDEPLSALDISVQSQIINLMLDLQCKLKISFVLISNNLPVLWHISDHLLVICNGEIVESGPTISVIDNPLHPYTQDILSHCSKHQKNDLAKLSSTERCVYSDRCARADGHCLSNKPSEVIIDDQHVFCHKI